MSLRPISCMKQRRTVRRTSTLLPNKIQNMFAHCSTVPAAFLRSCFSFFVLLSALFLSLFLPLFFLLPRLFLFSRSWFESEAIFLFCVLPATVDRAFCVPVEDLASLLPPSTVVPFPFLTPERSSFLSDFAHGWLVSICERVVLRDGKCYYFLFRLGFVDLFMS